MIGKFTSPELKPAKSICIDIVRKRTTSNTNYDVFIHNVLHNVIYQVNSITKFNCGSFSEVNDKIDHILKCFSNTSITICYHDNLQK